MLLKVCNIIFLIGFLNFVRFRDILILLGRFFVNFNYFCFILFDIFLFYGRRFLYILRYRYFFISIVGEVISSGLYIAVKNRRIFFFVTLIGFLGNVIAIKFFFLFYGSFNILVLFLIFNCCFV